MQLSFLGKSYTTSSPSIEATMTGETATFLGQAYARKRFEVAQRQQSVDLTYRGVRYSR